MNPLSQITSNTSTRKKYKNLVAEGKNAQKKISLGKTDNLLLEHSRELTRLFSSIEASTKNRKNGTSNSMNINNTKGEKKER